MGGEVSRDKLLNHDEYGRLVPTNFYSAIDKKLYGFGIPVANEMLKNLQEHYNIGVIVTLLLQPLQGGRMVNHQAVDSEEFDNPEFHDCDKNLVDSLKIKFVHMPIHDGYAPRAEIMRQFVQLVKQTNASGKAVGVHCWLGVGRTGSMLTGYLMNDGIRPRDAMNILGMRSGKYIKSPFQVKYLNNPKFPENPSENTYPELKISTPTHAKCYTQTLKEEIIPIDQHRKGSGNNKKTSIFPRRKSSTSESAIPPAAGSDIPDAVR